MAAINNDHNKLVIAGTTALIAEPLLVGLMHGGGVGAILGLVAGGAAYVLTDDIAEKGRGGQTSLPAVPVAINTSKLADFGYRMVNGKSARDGQSQPKDGRDEPQTDKLPDDGDLDLNGVDDFPRFRKSGDYILMSEVLRTFQPSVEQIFLARTEENKDFYCPARSLCHVALAGSTGNGKSSLIRMLMLQLCKARLQVLLLNPHYTRYDLESYGPDGKPCPEDWTPFEPYLLDDPMKCVVDPNNDQSGYPVIAHYLRQAAQDIIPKRLSRRANGIPVGKPYFIVLDELPAIVKHVKEAPDWMGTILREGRKVGVFLISAAQNFHVKTVSPDEGGADRDNYRTAYYTGGDATTATNLLDMPAKNIKEDELGKGVAMLRSVACKKAIKVFIPYVDNEALYSLLGPSTYQHASVGSGVDIAFSPSPEPQATTKNQAQNFVAPGESSESETGEILPVKQTEKLGEDLVKVGENLTSVGESFTLTHGDETAILMAVIDLQMANVAVTREAIKQKLGWNNKKHDIVKAVCDKHKIAVR